MMRAMYGSPDIFKVADYLRPQDAKSSRFLTDFHPTLSLIAFPPILSDYQEVKDIPGLIREIPALLADPQLPCIVPFFIF